MNLLLIKYQAQDTRQVETTLSVNSDDTGQNEENHTMTIVA